MVNARDKSMCIFCGIYCEWNLSNAHVRSRAYSGLGIEQNIITACPRCHIAMDNSIQRKSMVAKAKKHIANIYGEWDEELVTYRKGN